MQELSLNEEKSIVLEILDEFHNFCNKNNLKYSLFYGSLLGAIRHNGFIPWDDDIDVVMPREDYDFFIKNYKNDRFGVFYSKTKNFFLPSAKMFDKQTLKIENVKVSKKFEIGLDIDIFPIDYISNIDEYEKIQKKKRIWMNLKILAFYPPKSNKNILFKLLVAVARPFGNLAVRKIDRIGQKYNKKQHNYCIANPMFGKEKLIFPIDMFSDLTLHKFENKEFLISSKYDEILKIRYGEYMKLPPKENQVTHHSFSCYKK